MADNETSYLPIGTCLEQIEKAVYGREVRQAIHDGIAQCYDDTVEGVNAAQQAASDTQDVIDNAVAATNRANTAAAEASNVKVEQTVSGDTVTFTTTKRDGSTVSTSFQRPNVVVSKDENSGEFSVTGVGWNGEEIIAKIPDPSEEVKSRATIAAVSKVKTALGNPLTITDGMDAPAVKTVVTLEPKQDLHGYDHPWVGGAGKNLLADTVALVKSRNTSGQWTGDTYTQNGVTFVLTSFDGVSINNITVSGEASADTYFRLDEARDDLPTETLIASGSPIGSSVSSCSFTDAYSGRFNKSGTGDSTFTTNSRKIEPAIKVISGAKITNLVFTPMIRLATEADATYEPYSNICPIEGYDTVQVTATGKNLLPCVYDSKTVADVIFKKQSDGSYLLDGVASANIGAERFYIGDGYFLKPNTNYILSGCPDGGSKDTYRLVVGFNDAVTALIDTGNGVAFTSPSSWTNFMVYPVVLKGQNMSGKVFAPMIRLATEGDSTYEPFGSTTSLSVAQAAGDTVYGGTVTVNEDGSGTLVVDRVYAEFDGSNDETWMLAGNNDPQYAYFRLTLGAINSVINHSEVSNAFMDENITGANTNSGVQVLNSSAFNAATLYVRLREMSEYTTVDSFRSYLASNPLQIVYKSSTFTTYTLTASQLRTLTGKNHVWTNGTKLELTYRADKYADVEKFLNAIPTGTKTGDPAVFADGADDLPFEKLTIAVEPHQEGSGDPSPDNIRPITGWDEVKVTRCGKNLFDPAKAEMIAIDAGNTQRYGCSFDNLPAGQYTVSVVALGDTIDRSVFYKYYNGTGYSSSTRITNASTGSVTVSLPEGCRAFVYIDATNASTGSNALENVIGIQFEAGSTATSYEPYTYTTLPISLKYATGSTVYGGTVTINRDGTGSVVVDRKFVRVSDTTKIERMSESSGYTTFQNRTTIIDNGTAFGICNKLVNSRVVSGVLPSFTVTANSLRMSIAGSLTLADFNTWLTTNGPLDFVISLATPITYTLTAPQLTSLLGNNTVWCDAGQVTVKYKRDIGKALDAMQAALIEAGLYIGDPVIAEPGA